MKHVQLFLVLAVFTIVVSCKKESIYLVTVSNTLDVPRSLETIEINKSDLTSKEGESFENLFVRDSETKTILITQFVDEDQDGEVDVLLFQPEIAPNSEKQFELVVLDQATRPETIDFCYSRFVPERTDDYAWENDRVAFRTYGPTAQKMVEDSIKGGTLSSGIDAWLKRVDYPIINKWYDEEISGKSSYHKDTGEGLDNFHVGISRGVGGISVKSDTTFYISRNFTKWKTITNGPIRTSFVLEYADWDTNGQSISEKKHISLDFGSNLSRFEMEISGTDSFYSGLTLHENDGTPTQNQDAGWISYWQPHEDSELGTAIVVPNNNMISSELYVTTLKDQSNLYAQVKVNDNKGVYYAGFGWKKSEQFVSKETWESYLNDFTLKINNPLVVTLK